MDAGDSFSNSRMLLLLCVVVLLLSGVVSSVAELHRFLHPPKDDASLSLLVVGDWGRRGAYNQSEVAAQIGRDDSFKILSIIPNEKRDIPGIEFTQMGIIGEKLEVDFVISTGDNFYDCGLKGTDDPAFEESFSKIYTAPSLQKQWYSVLGNHDYRGDVEAQMSPILRELDNRWICMRSFIVDAEIVEFFFVDTTPFVDKYFIDPKDQVYDWKGVMPRQNYLSNLLEEVDSAIKDSNARWKIVVGHHTIISAGRHGDTEELLHTLLPILEENEVDMYINGHDHCLQHVSSSKSGVQFLTSGGGSKAWRDETRWMDPEELKFYYDGQGFMSLQITHSQARIAFFDIFGNPLHRWTSSKPLLHSTT